MESDGPIPAEFSMVCFGAVLFDDRLDQSFYGKVRPYLPDIGPTSTYQELCMAIETFRPRQSKNKAWADLPC
jgi:hypothetical protein